MRINIVNNAKVFNCRYQIPITNDVKTQT